MMLLVILSKHIFNDKCTIMSTDKDFLQLVDERIKVYSPTKKLMYDEERIKNEYGIDPKNFFYCTELWMEINQMGY